MVNQADYRIDQAEQRLAKIEGQVEELSKLTERHDTIVHRLLWGFFVLVAALAGKESILGALKGGTPWTEKYAFAACVITFTALTMWCFARAFWRNGFRWPLMLAGASILVAGMVRASMGFHDKHIQSSFFYGIPFLIGAAFVLWQEVRSWRQGSR